DALGVPPQASALPPRRRYGERRGAGSWDLERRGPHGGGRGGIPGRRAGARASAKHGNDRRRWLVPAYGAAFPRLLVHRGDGATRFLTEDRYVSRALRETRRHRLANQRASDDRGLIAPARRDRCFGSPVAHLA